jgi:hypothetical protein
LVKNTTSRSSKQMQSAVFQRIKIISGGLNPLYASPPEKPLGFFVLRHILQLCKNKKVARGATFRTFL